MSLIGRGATDAVYQLNALIAVKRACTGEHKEADHANEERMFQFLQSAQFAPNGSVVMLLNQYQERDSHGPQVLKVLQTVDLQDVHCWVRQLYFAAAGLERIGLVHGGIRPGNMLLDADWNFKLSDLDHGKGIGKDIAVLTEPWGRLLDEEDGRNLGTYGKAGARRETFAIGSVYYTLLRGHEPYETECWGRNRFVVLSEKFQKKEFPPLTDSAGDAVIRKCWTGDYQQVEELLGEFIDDAEQDEPTDTNQESLKMRQMECKDFIQSGLVETLDRY